MRISSVIREMVFGLEDGMVSTLGVVTGIAGATMDSFTVVLSGLVLIAVEALSMGVGEYASSRSKQEVWERKMRDEQREIREKPKEERRELEIFLQEKGLSAADVTTAADLIVRHPAWMLEEMAVHEHGGMPNASHSPVTGGVVMFIAYIIGGIVPLAPYLFFSPSRVLIPSIIATAFALFVLGAWKGRITTGRWVRSGCEMVGLSLTAAGIGYAVGRAVTSVV